MLIGNHYEIGDVLGVGGMGTVYKGTDTLTGQTVAVKQLKQEVIASAPEVVERFAREGEALRNLNHPNIVKMLTMLEENGNHYLIMEYVAGGDLRGVLRQETMLPLERLLTIAIQLADALTRAHFLKIIHRDLKPANVLLTADGTPLLADFGVAHIATKGRVTQSGVTVGTLDYLSPEAVNGETLDVRADIWALGVMLYEMLTGKRPFSGDSANQTLAAILTQPVPADFARLRPGCPAALADLIQWMLQKDRSQRISSTRLVGANLEEIIQGRSSTARHETRSIEQEQATTLAPPQTNLDQRIYFIKSFDGAQIAYATIGSGRPLVRAAHYLCHLEQDLTNPLWRHWLEGLSKENTYIRYDERGTGMADWDAQDLSFEAALRDLEAVVDSLGLERFVLFGPSHGGPVAMQYAFEHPERVSHLILYGTFLGARQDKKLSQEEAEEAALEREMTRIGWGKHDSLFRQFFAMRMAPEAATAELRAFTETMLMSTSTENNLKLRDEIAKYDVRDVAPKISVPTLVLHCRGDLAVAFEEGRRVAAAIPKARFVTLEGKNHIMLSHDTAWPKFLDTIHQFLAE